MRNIRNKLLRVDISRTEVETKQQQQQQSNAV